MKTAFLTYTKTPHHAHLGFAKAIKADLMVLPFKRYADLMSRYSALRWFFPLISYAYAFFMRISADILLTEGGTCLYAACILKLKNPGLKLIHLDADLFFYSLDTRKLTTAPLAIKKIDAVISVSEQNRQQVVKHLNVPTKVCPPYPEIIPGNSAERQNYGLFVGRLTPEKNIDRHIEFARQCSYFEKFFIIGDGSLRRYVEKKAEICSTVIFKGWQENVAHYYAKCKFLIHLPDKDSHPVACMEAALCGCYPIISSGTGSQYLFDDIFIAQDPDDSEALNAKIAYILANPAEANSSLKNTVGKMPTRLSSLSKFKSVYYDLLNRI